MDPTLPVVWHGTRYCYLMNPVPAWIPSLPRIEELILELKKEYTIVIVTCVRQAARVSDYTAFLYLGVNGIR